MRKKIASLDKNISGLIHKVGRLADHKRLPAYIVGGVVRDILLRKKVNDLDFVIEGDAIKFAKQFADKYNGMCRVYNDFGTATVELQHSRVDFSTARSEYYVHPGALPKVKKGSILDDSFRRDFTVNAMAVSINEDNFGLTVDKFGGLNDLNNKRIRILHKKSFIDDPTRILRAIRFEQRLGFKIEAVTLKLLKNALKAKREKSVKCSRYFREFKKILLDQQSVNCLRRLNNLGGLSFLHVKNLNFSRLNDVYKVKSGDWFIYFLAIIQNVPISKLAFFGHDFHLTKDECKALKAIPNIESTTKLLSIKKIRRGEIFNILKKFPQSLSRYILATTKNLLVRKRIKLYLENLSKVSLKITGHDLKRFGQIEQRSVGVVLNKILMAKMDNILKTKSDELRYARTLIMKG